MSAPIIVYGSLAYDVQLGSERSLAEVAAEAAEAKETALCCVRASPIAFGGNGGNIAWHLALLKKSPMLISTMGHDGAQYLERLKSVGIDTSHIAQRTDCPTTTIWLVTDQKTEGSIAFYDDRASRTRRWTAKEEDATSAIVLVGPGKPDVTLSAMNAVHGRARHVIWDPGQDVHAFKKEEVLTCLEHTTILVLNSAEFATFQRMLGMDGGGMLAKVPVIIETRGKDGARMTARGATAIDIPAAKPKTAVSSWGAGDAFRSGMLLGLSEKPDDIPYAIRTGYALASLVLEIEGTQLPSLREQHIIDRL